jgi:hypothetical protein
MPWARLDDTFHAHPKTAEAGTVGVGLFTLSLSYCSQYLTDGFVSPAVVRRLISDVDDPISIADRLVLAGYFEVVDGGYQIHEYLVYNPSRAKVLKEREEAKERMRGAREHRQPNAECSVEVPANITGSSHNPVPIPDPLPVTTTKVCAATPPPAIEPETNPPPEPPEKPKRRGNWKSAIALLYHANMGMYPNAVQETEIAATVTDTELFAACMKAWRLKGYAPTNVPGVLDWYRRGGPPANGHARDRPPPIQAPTVEKVYIDMPGFNVGNNPREEIEIRRRQREAQGES